MKCKVCGGTGKRFVPTNKNAITGNGYTADCLFCNGTGEIELTNEQWFCSLSTDEKARLLVDEKLHFRMLDFDGFVKWLKEKHDEM